MTDQVESVEDVLRELMEFVGEEVAATAMALGAMRTLAHQALVFSEANPDGTETFLVGAGVPDVGWILRFDGTAGARKYAEQLGPGGPTVQRITSQLIVTIDTAWEEEFRGRLARASGLSSRREVKAAFFADLRRLRNDIVHHRGVTTAENGARCTTLRRSFAPGDPIYLDDQNLLNFRYLIPLADLERIGRTYD